MLTRAICQQRYPSRIAALKTASPPTTRLLSTTITGRLAATAHRRLPKQRDTSVEKQYSDTLLLPRTDFPLRANAVKRDPLFRERCTDRLYAWQKTRSSDGREFTLHDGPPYANGDLHMGHALNKILKDIILRYKLLRGYRINYVPGWDCHGLPIEQKALANADRSKLTPMQIRARARTCALEAVEKQKEQFRSWSILGDWDRSYLTLTPDYEARQVRVFGQMVKNRLIYRRYKPVYWSPSSRTALAEAELEYRDDHKSRSVYVHYPLTTMSEQASVSALIWTTTPWTLPANTAIAIGNDLAYGIVRVEGQSSHMLVAMDRLEALRPLLEKQGNVEVVATIEGRDLVGCQYRQPISQSTCSILHGDHVTSGSGTGLVHTAPAHGQEDFSLCRQHSIELINCVDDDGRFTEKAGPFAGLSVLKEGTGAVIAWLREHGLLLDEHAYTHNYPYDWRSKQPVILRATWQWFADVTDIREDAAQAIASTIEHVASVFAQHGSNAWWQLSTQELLPPSYAAQYEQYRRGMDTMDVWFDSGTSWSMLPNHSCLPLLASPPADVYLEGSDQHRGWFQSSLLTSSKAHGHKMSKSIGNIILPRTIIEGGPDKKKQPAYGSDVLRLWVASTEYTRDVTMSHAVVANVAESMRKYRSTARFMLGCLYQFDLAAHKVDYNALLPIDQYLLHELHRFATTITHAYEAFAFNRVVQELNRFTNAQLSAFYFESIKERLYADDQQSLARRSAQTTIYHIIDVYMRVLAPITCHLAEEIQLFSSSTWSKPLDSVFQSGWLPLEDRWCNAALEQEWTTLRHLRAQFYQLVEKARQTK
ncbi:tRNA synthetases class I-domain-containing protein [Syncephalis pseudoplumigaleata]|uniref:Isoleucine--tRNA ligase, mitochondrial n=1 Tax=Syncephalis pseudoplumigaleata TaxID=1712513 RepID=A0A4P9Z4Q5_9FUNG|nr:tRNA synthetases class I-domain-containing protein [Syncephalis pseudoplumigaleata]|eukprot:RKP27445.1 tRNA synthetases class I-domain-containing protein [Syncephalis pseudoplumigaleata]